MQFQNTFRDAVQEQGETTQAWKFPLAFIGESQGAADHPIHFGDVAPCEDTCAAVLQEEESVLCCDASEHPLPWVAQTPDPSPLQSPRNCPLVPMQCTAVYCTPAGAQGHERNALLMQELVNAIKIRPEKSQAGSSRSTSVGSATQAGQHGTQNSIDNAGSNYGGGTHDVASCFSCFREPGVSKDPSDIMVLPTVAPLAWPPSGTTFYAGHMTPNPSSAYPVGVYFPVPIVASPQPVPAGVGVVATGMPVQTICSAMDSMRMQPFETDAAATPGNALDTSMMPRENAADSARPLTTRVGHFFGQRHRFHNETNSYGVLSEDCREFTKTKYNGLLSVVTEDTVHTSGVLNYAVRFTKGALSSADGVGFVFSPKLPVCKNIQKIISIFVNRAGRICMRARNQVHRSDISVKALEVGDWIGVTIDLSQLIATFVVWPSDGSRSTSATMAFGDILNTSQKAKTAKPLCGYFACVMKDVGLGVTMGS